MRESLKRQQSQIQKEQKKSPLTLRHSAIFLSDRDRSREQKAWRTLLSGIQKLAKERQLNKKVFISYAWPVEAEERDKLQRWLKRLQENLEYAGMHVFLDLRDMQGRLDTTMSQRLEESDFVMPILTPRFLERAQDEKTNLAFEYQLTLKKAEEKPASLLPILRAGAFSEVIKNQLALLNKYLVYMGQESVRIESLLVGLSDPLGLIPVIYGIRIGDQQYQTLLNTWLQESLTRLPLGLPNSISRPLELKQLKTGFSEQAQRKRSPIQILHGMGGVGKSQLALEYAQQITAEFDFVRWIDADVPTLALEWLSLGERLGLDLKGSTESEQRQMIREALSERPRWLLVLDNLENQQALQGLLPERQTDHQWVLITSRSKSWGALPVMSISPFTPEQCEEYFQARLPIEQCEGAADLAKKLEYLPLALSHAVAYMQQSDLSAKAYLDRFEKLGITLLADEQLETEAKDAHYNATILTTWQLSIERLEKRDAQAAELVKFCGYLYAEGIQRRLLQVMMSLEELTLDKCIRVIRDYALLTYESGGFKMHRLVQAAVRYFDGQILSVDKQLELRLKPLAYVLKTAYPDFQNKTTEEILLARQLEPHLSLVSKELTPFVKLEPGDEKSPAALQSHLLLALGNLYEEILGKPTQAKQFCERSLELRKAVYGKEHPEIAVAQVELGDVEMSLGHTKKAKKYYESSLNIRKAKYSEEHSEVAESYNRLGNAYLDLGDAKLALEYQKKAFDIRLKVYGKEHVKLSDSYNDLGLVYEDLGDYKETLQCHQKSLAISLKIYGEEHPDIAVNYCNIGGAYEELGDAKKALEYYRKDLAISLKVYGEEDPGVAITYGKIGGAYQKLGDIKEAFGYHQKKLDILLKVYGEEHPEVAVTYNNIGESYKELGDAKEALVYHQKSFAIQLKVHEEGHPEFAATYCHMGRSYVDLGDAKKALEHHQKDLAISLKAYGEEHPGVAITYGDIGKAYLDLGNAKEALKYFEKALVINTNVYGEEHPDVAVNYRNLGNAYCDLGDAKTACEYQTKALAIHLKKNGEKHPLVAKCYSGLGKARQVLKEDKSALDCYEKSLDIRLQTYGENHPEVAQSYQDLGSFYQDTSPDREKAKFYLEKALTIYRFFDRQQAADAILERLSCLTENNDLITITEEKSVAPPLQVAQPLAPISSLEQGQIQMTKIKDGSLAETPVVLEVKEQKIESPDPVQNAEPVSTPQSGGWMSLFQKYTPVSSVETSNIQSSSLKKEPCCQCLIS